MSLNQLHALGDDGLSPLMCETLSAHYDRVRSGQMIYLCKALAGS